MDDWEDEFVLVSSRDGGIQAPDSPSSPTPDNQTTEQMIEQQTKPKTDPVIEPPPVYQCDHPEIRTGDSVTYRNIQTQAFCGWLTYLLRKQDPSAETVRDLCAVFTNARQLGLIALALTGSTVPGLVEVDSAYGKITNLNLMMDAFCERYPDAGAVSASAIASNNPKAALDFAWVLFYNAVLKPIKYCGLEDRFALLLWIQHAISAFPHTPVVHDFTSSFADGLSIGAILESKAPGSIDVRNWSNIHRTDNLRKAFETAEKLFGIPKIISPIDVTSDQPDEISMILYLTLLYEKFKN
jgi:hypothetical protein